jgi:hypothetical protein
MSQGHKANSGSRHNSEHKPPFVLILLSFLLYVIPCAIANFDGLLVTVGLPSPAAARRPRQIDTFDAPPPAHLVGVHLAPVDACQQGLL